MHNYMAEFVCFYYIASYFMQLANVFIVEILLSTDHDQAISDSVKHCIKYMMSIM